MSINPLETYQGMEQTANLHDNRVVRAIDPALVYLSGNDSPMARLLESLSLKEDLTSSPFKWDMEDIYALQVVASAAATAAAGLIAVPVVGTDWKQMVVNDLYVNNATGTVYMVSETPSTNNVKLMVWYTPPAGSANVAANAKLTSIGNAMHEGSDPRAPIHKAPAYEENLIQEFRNTLSISDRANSFTYLGTSEYDNQMKKLYIKHQLDKEMAIWSGVKGDSNDGVGRRVTTTGGIEYFLRKANSRATYLDLGNQPLTRPELNNLLSGVFQQGTATERWMFCGANAAGWLDAWLDDKVFIPNQEVRKLGIYCSDYESRYGILHVVNHRLFNRIGWDNRAFLLDLDKIELRALPGRGTTRTEADTQPPGRHAKQTDLWCEWGLKIEAVESQAIISNIAEVASRSARGNPSGRHGRVLSPPGDTSYRLQQGSGAAE